MYKNLPLRPNLQHLKHQSKTFLKDVRSRGPGTYVRIRAVFPRFAKLSDEAFYQTKFGLQDAQLVIAREYDFDSWEKLRQAVRLHMASRWDRVREDHVSAELARVVRDARLYAVRFGHMSVGTGHLLLGLVDDERDEALSCGRVMKQKKGSHFAIPFCWIMRCLIIHP